MEKKSNSKNLLKSKREFKIDEANLSTDNSLDKSKKSKDKKDKKRVEEYSSDSSDEDVLVRTGNIPQKWYNDFDHKGYSLEGKKVIKNEESDNIEKFLEKAKDKDWWKIITDDMNNTKITLSQKDLEMIQRIRSGLYATANVMDDDEYFEKNIEIQKYPIRNHMLKKKSFEPSAYEKKMINRISKMIENGFVSIEKPKRKGFFDDMEDVWLYENTNQGYHPSHGYMMPKPDAPDNDLSYNFNDPFVCLRKTPRYEKLINDQFERLNDIFSNTRVIKKKRDIKEEEILPKVPSPSELKPFPTKDNINHMNHASNIKFICIEPSGDYIFTADTANFLQICDILTGKVLFETNLREKIKDIQYNSFLSVVTVLTETRVLFIQPGFLYRKSSDKTIIREKIIPLLKEKIGSEEVKENDKYTWSINDNCKKDGILFTLTLNKGMLLSIKWHIKGDYFGILAKNELGKSTIDIFALSTQQFISPLNKNKGNITCIDFHNSKPHFYICSDSNILIYDLKQQELIRKFASNLNPISSISLHKLGGDFVAGSGNGKLAWFQSDLSDKPFMNMADYHEGIIKGISFSNNYPLLSSCSVDGKIILYHAKVNDDFLQDPTIVPLTSLNSFYGYEDKEVNGIKFHPNYPWLISVGSNKQIKIWT